MTREKITVEAMISLHCHDLHRFTDRLCPDCRVLLDYAMARLKHCPFQDTKPTCAQCRIHCYQPPMRDQIRNVMRYAGPRMVIKHPILALQHMLDRWRNGSLPVQ